MQILITHGVRARTRLLRFNRWQALAAVLVLGTLAMLLSATAYHLVFVKAAREGWPVVSPIVRLLVRDEFAQRDRFMRENLDAMAQKVGEMQAKLVKLEAMGERVSAMTGVKFEEVKTAAPKVVGGGQGGPYIPAGSVSFEQLNALVGSLDQDAEESSDLFTLVESRLFEKRLTASMVPNSRPLDGPVGSGFGFRSDPFSGRSALHTGLDFPAAPGTHITAAAGGVVRSAEFHPQYGNLLEIDHRNGLTTRYAHTSAFHVKPGDLVRRGQHVADVGTTGRSTGPHLHFEVTVDGVLQDPAKFLAGKGPVVADAAEPRTVAAHR
jgi:murein DD-endopeptidase MepM/ murein hydrolase activator NlpD